MYLTSLAHLTSSYPGAGLLRLINATASAPKNVLFSCSFVRASTDLA